MIRKATDKDIESILELLWEADKVHSELRPDLFKSNTTKYDREELRAILNEETTPVFLFDDGKVRAHAFCKVIEQKDEHVLMDMKTMYIDDICVEAEARGRHIGKALYDHVVRYAKTLGCYNVTLNVWEGNTPAQRFYESMGMRVQKTTMEVIL